MRAAIDPSPAPFVFTGHAQQLRPLSRILARQVIRRADGVVALSKTELLGDRPTSLVSWRTRVIPNGIDPGRFIGDQARERGPGVRLLYAGQLIALKRLDVLLNAIALLNRSDVTLALAYHVDRELRSVREIAGRLSLLKQIQFLGRLTQAELAGEYARAHALVLASDTEALPSVITESLLSGTPVVATDVGSIREQVAVYGVVVPPGNPSALAQGITRLLSDYADYERRRTEMVRYARNGFSIDAMVSAHLKLYGELANGSPVRHEFAGNPSSFFLNLALGLPRARPELGRQRQPP